MGKNTAQMQQQSVYTDPPASWDFSGETANGTDDVWHMPYNLIGYPMLYWQRDITGDIVGHYGVDLEDFNYMANRWLSQSGLPGWNGACDLSHDGVINLVDLKILLNYYLEGRN